MYKINYYNLQEFCRICLKHLANTSEKNFTRDNSYNIQSSPQLAFLLKIFISLDVFKQPQNWPESICQLCYEKVHDYENFRISAIRNEEILQTISKDGFEKHNAQRVESNPYQSNNYNDYNDDDQLLLPELLGTLPIKSEPTNDSNEDDDESVFSTNSKTYMENDIFIKTEYQEVDFSNNIEQIDARDCTTVDSVATDATIANAREIAENQTQKKTKKNRKSLKCERCDKQVYKLAYLEAHIRSVHEGHEKPFLCRECDKSFTRYNQLHVHIQTNHQQPQPSLPPVELLENANDDHTCPMCNRKYSSKRALGEHIKRHAQIKEHVCNHCGVAKVTRTELLTHLRTHETNLEKFKCNLCPQLFNHKNAISRHVRVVHEGQRRFKCNYCQKKFGTRNAQTCHERLHTGERPHTCEICLKRFTQIDRLMTHKRSHNRNLCKYVCSYCTKRCFTRQNLMNHERRHSSDRPYICNICCRGFMKVEQLSEHKKTPCRERTRKDPIRKSAITATTIEQHQDRQKGNARI